MTKVCIASLTAALACAILPTAAPQSGTTLKTFRQSTFTAEQANRGEQVYARTCSMCHGDNLQGVGDGAGSGGRKFQARLG